jgi:hypothetical protein
MTNNREEQEFGTNQDDDQREHEELNREYRLFFAHEERYVRPERQQRHHWPRRTNIEAAKRSSYASNQS